MNYFEQLLEKIDDPEARTQFTELAAKHTFVNDWVIDPALRARAEEVTTWAENEWDYDHNMSKLEFQQSQQLVDSQNRLAALQGQVDSFNTRGNAMELKDLDEHLGKFMTEKGLMTKADHEAVIAQKEAAFNEQLGLTTVLATRIPYLNAQYQKDYGEMFDPDVFVTQANEKGYAKHGAKGLDEYYKEFTAEKALAKQNADLEKRAEALATEKYEAKLRERGTQTGAAGLGNDSGPEMGHFEARLKGISKTVDPNAPQAPADLELGRGGIARFAANAADAKDRAAGFVN